jgi:hypothetical protein
MKKIIIRIFCCLLPFILLTGCDKEDLQGHRLSRGNGRWKIFEIITTTYDTAGNVTSTTSKESKTEIQVYSTGSLSALYGYFPLTVIEFDSLGNPSTTIGEIMTDKDRVHVDAESFLKGWWTTVGFGGRKQTWLRVKNRATYYKNSTLESTLEIVWKKD